MSKKFLIFCLCVFAISSVAFIGIQPIVNTSNDESTGLSTSCCPKNSWDYSDDVFHEPNREDRFAWDEWLYFNFVDETTGLTGIISYTTQDIYGSTLIELANINDPYMPFYFIAPDKYAPLEYIETSMEDPAMYVLAEDYCYMEDGNFLVHLERVADEYNPQSCVIDLIFTPKVEPSDVYYIDMEDCIYQPSFMNWVIGSLKNEVTGTIQIDQDVFTINGYGYHDHNWMSYIWGDSVTFDWGQVSQDKAYGWSIDIAQCTDGNRTVQRAEWGILAFGSKIVDDFKSVQIEYSNFVPFEIMPELGYFPANARYEGIGSKYKVVMETQAIKVFPIPSFDGTGIINGGTLIWEFCSVFEVTIYRHFHTPHFDIDIPISSFTTMGYNEYFQIITF